MLLRSSSTPLLDSWIPQSKEAIVETHPPESVVPPIPKRRSLSLTLSRSSSISSNNDDDSVKKMSRALSVTDIKEVHVHLPKKQPLSMNDLPSIPLEVEEDQEDVDFDLSSRASSMKKLFMTSGVSESANTKKKDLAVLSMPGGGGIDRNGGGGGGRNSDSNDNHEKRSVEAYYQNMIQANPGNALFLVNYAKYLKEVKCDLEKAEEYCGRAILANPNDGQALSLYADLIWQKNKDAPRAEVYFEQAVQAAPDDCYVMASYARFLWDAEDDEDEEEEEVKEVDGMNSHNNRALQLNFYNGTPLTA